MSAVDYRDDQRQERGSVLLSISIIIFLGAMSATIVSGWLLWRDGRLRGLPWHVLVSNEAPSLPLLPTPSGAVSELLTPEISLDPGLESEAELEQKLLQPLRAYYATRPERLGTVRVEPGGEEHTTKVTIELVNNGERGAHSFFYDRTGKGQDGEFPRWEPSMLDNTN